MPVRLHVWGAQACFTRPEMKVERVSYPVLTPSAARGILEAIYWKPAICWRVERIHVLKPVHFQSIQRNEISATISAASALAAMQRGHTSGLGMEAEAFRQQRTSLILVEVGYVIEARFDILGNHGPGEGPGRHLAMFNRRARLGQCFHRPFLGNREFAAEFALLGKDDPLPPSTLERRNADFGWMLHDIDFGNARQARFFRAILRDGIIEVPPFCHEAGLT